MVQERGAVAEAALAEVVEAEVPVGAGGRMVDAQQLVHVPVGQDLRAEHAVVLVLDAAEVVRRVVQVGGHDRPVEDGQVVEVEHVVPRRGQPVVLRGWPVTGSITGWPVTGSIDRLRCSK